MRSRLAEMAAKQLLVSPRISTASGASSLSAASARVITVPMVSAAVAPAASRNLSGGRNSRSSKNTWLSS